MFEALIKESAKKKVKDRKKPLCSYRRTRPTFKWPFGPSEAPDTGAAKDGLRLGHGHRNIYRHGHLLGIVESQLQPMPSIC